MSDERLAQRATEIIVTDRRELVVAAYQHTTVDLSENAMKAEIGVARAKYAWPVIAVAVGGVTVGLAVVVGATIIRSEIGLVAGAAVLAPATWRLLKGSKPG